MSNSTASMAAGDEAPPDETERLEQAHDGDEDDDQVSSPLSLSGRAWSIA